MAGVSESLSLSLWRKKGCCCGGMTGHGCPRVSTVRLWAHGNMAVIQGWVLGGIDAVDVWSWASMCVVGTR